MKKNFIISFGFMVALFTMSVCLTSCSDDYGNAVNAPQQKDTTTSDPTPQQPTDSTKWHECLRRWNKVFENADVISVLVGQRNNGKLDSLTLKYKYEYALAKDTTLYLDEAPTGDLGYSTAADRTDYSEYSHNMQGDSVCFINYAKPYYLSNGVNLSLKTQRVRGYHMMGGQPVMYSEPTQSVARLQIEGSTDEFERNDSIFGRRINTCSVELTLGGQRFVPSCTVTEIWFKSVKEKPEPSFNVTLNEYAKFICGSKVKVSKNNWKDAFLFVGAKQIHVVVANLDNNGGRALSYEVKSVDLSRVVFNGNVNGVIYDETTGLFIPALITPDNKDKNGWFTDGEIDGRSVTYDPTNAQAVEEGIKNFVGKDTSVPTPFFVGNPSTSNTNWKEYTYTSVTWSKYSKDTDMVTQTMTVKMPAK